MEDKKQSGILLVVEDNLGVREVTKAMLERCGFSVLAAEDGEQGVRLFQENSAEIRAALVDLIMPGIDGQTTIKRIRELQPNVKVILTSGHSETEAKQVFGALGINGFIQKPFDIIQLSQKIRDVLED